MISLSDIAFRQSASDHVVAWKGDQSLTYDQLVRDIATLCHRLPWAGAIPICCQDSYYFVVAIYAVLHSGGRVVLPADRTMAQETSEGGAGPVIDDQYVRATLSHSRGGPLERFSADRAYLDFFTSGSTGEPKRVTRSLAQFERELSAMQGVLGGDSGMRVLATVPHHHVYGITFKIFLALGLEGGFHRETLLHWEDVRKEVRQGDFLVTSPAHLSRLGGLERFQQAMAPGGIVSAGAPLSAEASHESLQVLGRHPVEIFGSTETGAVASRVQVSKSEPWLPLPGVAVRRGEDCRLEILSPFVGEAWFAMADRVRLEGKGFYHLGRADNIVKIEGKRVSTIRMVKAIEQLPGVRQALVVVLENPTRLGAAVILTSEGEDILAEQGRFRTGRFFRRELAKTNDAAGIPRQWRFVVDFPVQSMGKYCLSEITAWFETT